MLDEIQVAENWSAFRKLINETFSGERRDRLNAMYDYFDERIILAPASGKEHFHNAFPGGYIDHVLRVERLSRKFCDLWKEQGANINFTDEELAFSAIHHDLGKLGDLDNDYYIVNDSEWHREKLGMIYKFNPDMNHMPISDRSFFLLQYFQVQFSQIEWMAIKCTDGLYESDNEAYLIQTDPGKIMKTNIVYIMHQADVTAWRLERDRWLNSVPKKELTENPKKYRKKTKEESIKLTEHQKQLMKDIFD